MPWPRPTLQALIARIEGDIKSRLTSGAALLRKSFLAILARVWAGLHHEEYGYQQWQSQQMVESTVTDLAWTQAYADTWGVPRKPASFAAGFITVTGTNTTIVPAGTTWVSDIGEPYTTDADATIASGTAVIPVTAVNAGSDANLDEDDIDPVTLSIQTPISGVTDTATVTTSIEGGTEQETQEDWRARIVESIQNPAAGGTADDYRKWALSVPGVQNAFILPLFYGLNTLVVVILPGDSTYTETACSSTTPPADPSTILGKVYTYIESRRPVTAWVQYQVAVPVEVDLTIAISPNNAGVQSIITSRLAAMFKSDSLPNGILYLSHLNEAISGIGVLDQNITGIKVAGVTKPIANYQFTDFNYTVLGTLTFTSL